MPRAIRVYTQYGRRAHYLSGNGLTTFCGFTANVFHDATVKHARLAQAAVCSRCEKAEELTD